MRRTGNLALVASVVLNVLWGTLTAFLLIGAERPIGNIGAGALPSSPPMVLSGDPQFISFFALGDTGKSTSRRRRVVRGMVDQASRTRLDFVMLLGDNFYESGVRSVNDRLWQREFERPFGEPELRVPFYAALGNHDHKGSIQAQIDYSRLNPRWRMPHSYHSFVKPLAEGCFAEFFVLDTLPIHTDPGSQEAQIQWLRESLVESQANWKIVAGHHPILSGGAHGGSESVSAALRPIFREYKVDLYMSGHDHDLQLHASEDGWLQLVSGAGCKVRRVDWVDSTLYAAAVAGFTWVVLTPEEMSIQIVTVMGQRYKHRVVKEEVNVASI